MTTRFAVGSFFVFLLALLAGCSSVDPALSAAYEPLPDRPLVVSDAKGYPRPNIPDEINDRSEARHVRNRIVKESVEQLRDEMNESMARRPVTDSLVEDVIQLQSQMIDHLEELVRLHRAEEADLLLTMRCFDAATVAVLQKVEELEAGEKDQFVVRSFRDEYRLFRRLSVSYLGMAKIRGAVADSFDRLRETMLEQRKELQAKSG